MGNKVDASPDKGKPTPAEVLALTKSGYNFDDIKAQVAKMETADRTQLVQDLRAEKLKVEVSVDLKMLQRLNALEEQVQNAEKSFGTKAQEGVGAAFNSLGAGAQKGLEMAGNQVQKGVEGVAQIGAQVAQVMEDPNRSAKEKAIHIAGIAALVVIPAAILYKICSAISGDGKKPSFGRKLLKWTGFAFLGSMGVRALAPFVADTQKGFMIQSKEAADAASKKTNEKAKPAATPKTAVQNPVAEAQPEAEKEPEGTVLQSFDFDGKKVDIIEHKGQKLVRVGKTNFRVETVFKTPSFGGMFSQKELPVSVLPLVQNTKANVDGGITINDAAVVSKGECARLASELADATEKKTISVKATVDGAEREYTLECTPEKLS